MTTTAQFLETLDRLGLLSPAHAQAMATDRALMARDAPSAARELIARGWLTAYQVYQIFLGKGDDLVLGSYVMLERLGEGAMGQVFKARHTTMGRLVAVKSLRPERLTNKDAVKRFQREMRAAGKISHPNFVLVFDADVHNGIHYYAMEYVEGPDLSHLVKELGPLPVATACEYVRQAAVGLEYAHGLGLIHRDIKPSNLLIADSGLRMADSREGATVDTGADTPSAVLPPQSGSPSIGVVKILDMGLARLVELAEESALTQEGKVLGTPDYIAPEQARNAHKADRRADLYSLGCTLYYLLTGRPPFPGSGTLIEKLMRHQTEDPVPIESVRADVPEGVRAILKRLIARKPDDRYQTAAELVVALKKLRLTAVEPPKPKTGRPIARATIVNRWYYTHQGQILGAFSTAEIRARARRGDLLPTDPVWPEGVEPSKAVPARALIDFDVLNAPPSAPKPAWLRDMEKVERKTTTKPPPASKAPAASPPPPVPMPPAVSEPSPPLSPPASAPPPAPSRPTAPLPNWLADVARSEELRARPVPPAPPAPPPPAPAPPAADLPAAAPEPPPASPEPAPSTPAPSAEPAQAPLPDWIDDIRRAEGG